MTNSDPQTTDRDQRLEQVLADYLHSVEAGRPLDQAGLVAGHPDLADELQSFFRNREALERIAAPLQDQGAANGETLLVGKETSDGRPRIRYFGDYELVDEIARGGMGVVYLAQQTSLNRTVAVKMIRSGQLASAEDVERFQAEAEAAASLQHPNIVAIHEVGQHEGQHYFSMDYVEGCSLADVVRERPLSVKRAAEYVKTIAEAIEYAHGKGVLHRDLKPSNILIDQSDEPRITDFGLAKRIAGDSKLTASGAVLGTPSYMPPEQAAAKRGLIGPAGDVYSLGAVLYELVTGRPPFHAETPVDTLLQVIEHEPVSLRKLNPNIPADLETICMKCLEKRPDARYASAQQLAEDLGRFLDHEPIHARPASAARKVWSWTKRKPWAITAVAAFFVVGLLSLAYWLWVENSFLRYTAAHADYVREPGTHTQVFDVMKDISMLFWPVLAWLFVFLQHYPPRCRRKGQPVSQRWLMTAGMVGTVGVLMGVAVAVQTINAAVWEGNGLFNGFMTTYVCCYFGGMCVVRAVSEYEQSLIGPSHEPLNLPDELRQRLGEVFLGEDAPKRWSKKVIAAMKHYRAETGSSLREARGVINNFVDELHQQYPDQVPDSYERMVKVSKSIGVVVGLLFLAPFGALMVPLFVLHLITGLITGDPQWVAGVVAFVASIGFAAGYRRNKRWLAAQQIAFGVLLPAGLAALLVFHPVLPVAVGTLIGIVTGVLFTYFVPKSRITDWGIAVNWKSRVQKAAAVGAIGGFVVGLIPPVVLLFLRDSWEFQTGDWFLFLGIPSTIAFVMAVTAAAAMGVLRYFHWASSRSGD